MHLSATKWHLLSVMVALIAALARCCSMNADSGCQIRTFEADGDALAERLSDQVPGGQRQLLTHQPLSISWKRKAETR